MLIDLLGLELGLQLLHLRSLLPLAPASAAVQLDPTGELVHQPVHRRYGLGAGGKDVLLTWLRSRERPGGAGGH